MSFGSISKSSSEHSFWTWIHSLVDLSLFSKTSIVSADVEDSWCLVGDSYLYSNTRGTGKLNMDFGPMLVATRFNGYGAMKPSLATTGGGIKGKEFEVDFLALLIYASCLPFFMAVSKERLQQEHMCLSCAGLPLLLICVCSLFIF